MPAPKPYLKETQRVRYIKFVGGSMTARFGLVLRLKYVIKDDEWKALIRFEDTGKERWIKTHFCRAVS